MQLNFYLKQLTRSTRKQPLDNFSDIVDPKRFYKASMQAAWFPDNAIDLWFNNEAEAMKVPKGVVVLTELLALFEPLNGALRCTGISKVKRYGAVNQYTNAAAMEEAWLVNFEASVASQMLVFVDLWYKVEAEARKWAVNRVYHAGDMLKALRVFIVWFPAAPNYDKSLSLAGWFDKFGYHVPGIFPAGAHGAGYSLGGFLALEPADSVVGGHAYLIGATSTYFVVQIISGAQAGSIETFTF